MGLLDVFRQNKWKIYLLFFISILLYSYPGLAATDTVTIDPTTCTDSGGTCDAVSNVQTQDGVVEDQPMHPSQSRFIQTVNTNTSAITSPDVINNVSIYIDRYEDTTGDSVTLSVTRQSDGTSTSCNIGPKTANNNVYEICDVTALITGSSSPESDAENLTIRYSVTGGGGGGNSMHLDHDYVNITYTDNTAPNVTLNSPEDNGWENNTNVTFQYTPNDITSEVSSCELILDGSTNQTNSTITENGINNFTVQGVSEGTHTWSVNCTDTSANANEGSSSTQSFTVDATKPNKITLNGPVNDTKSSDLTQTFNFTAEDNLASTMTCNLLIDDVQQNSTSATNNTATTISYALSEGIQNWSVQCLDQASNSNTSETRTITIDETAPSIANITNAPNSNADLDPDTNVTVTANITDNIELDTFILQYKFQNETNYTNTTMQLESGDLYNATFNATFSGTWTYRIYANDTTGNSNTSSETDISVILDPTWNQTDNIPNVKSIVKTDDRVFELGNITQNSTGDYDLNFNTTSNVTWITFNGTTNDNSTLNISSEGSAKFNATANTTGFAVGEYEYEINTAISYTNGTKINTKTVTGKVVIQNVAGPFLSMSVEEFDPDVTQGDSDVTYSVSVTNDGTGDGNDLWIAWSFPSGWTNTSGPLNKSFGFIGVGQTKTHTINETISSSAPTGSFTINTTANTSEGADETVSRSVTVNAASTGGDDGEDSTTTSGGGGGGGVSTGTLVERIISNEKVINSNDTFEILRGTNGTLNVLLKNVFDRTTIHNLTFRVLGYPEQHIETNPNFIESLEHEENRTIEVKIDVPSFEEFQVIDITLNARGRIRGPGVDRELNEEKTVQFIIHSITKEEASRSLDNALEAIQEMQEKGFITESLLIDLQEARTLFNNNSYEPSKALSDEIIKQKQSAFEANKIISSLDSRINSYTSITAAVIGAPRNYPESENLLTLSKAAFERGDYDTSLQRAKDAQLALASESGDFNLLFFILDWWWVILLALVFSTITGLYGYRIYLTTTITKKINNLDREEDHIRKETLDTQRKYYIEKKIGSALFNESMSRYQKRLSEISKDRIKLRNKRVRILSPEKAIHDLEKERKDVLNQLKEIQKDYFKDGKLSKKAYEEQEVLFHERLAEIEDEKLTLERLTTKEKVKKNKSPSKINPFKQILSKTKIPSFSIPKINKTKTRSKIQKRNYKNKKIKNTNSKSQKKNYSYDYTKEKSWDKHSPLTRFIKKLKDCL